jgi:hypothetical protein
MRRFIPLAVSLCLVAVPVHAASPNVEAAIATLAKLEADPTQLANFCKFSAQYDAAGEDEAKNEAADRQMENFLRSLGPDYIKAWQLSEDLDPASEDAKALDAAYDRLEAKCP